MKIVSLVLLFGAPLVLSALEVRPGDTLAEVRAAVGAPQGQLHLGDRHVLYYDRGEVELRGGAVTRVALRTADEHAAVAARREAEAVRVREEREIRRARLITEGEALKARKLADPTFQSTPFACQVAFWQDFSRRYPDVPSAEQLTAARLLLTGQLEKRRAQAEQAERLAQLETRVIEAEARAAEAEANVSRYHHRAYYYTGGYSRHHANNLWPVEYHFNDTPPQLTVAANRPGRDNELSDGGPDKVGRDWRGQKLGRHSHGSDLRNRL